MSASVTYATIRGYFNEVIGDIPVTATTDSTDGGNSDKKSAIAPSLIEYYDDFGENDLFVGRTLYIPSVAEERKIRAFMPESGTVSVYRAFTAEVGQSVAIEIHRHSIDRKKKALNRALSEAYTRRDFFNPSYNTTLYGQGAYGEDGYEYNRRHYVVPTTFEEFPTIKIVKALSGMHDGGDGEATLSVSGASFPVDGLIGYTVYNTTDGSSGTVTDNDATTVTATLSGGTDNDWDDDDEFIVQDPREVPAPFTEYVRTKGAGEYEFYASIPDGYLLLLEGRGPLTALSTESGTTELFDEDARVVCYLAGYHFFDSLAKELNDADAEPARVNAKECLNMYEYLRHPAKQDQQGCTIPVYMGWL